MTYWAEKGSAVEQRRSVRALLLACALASAVAVGVTLALGRPGLDVALWAVLAPIAAGALLAPLPRLRGLAGRRTRREVVVPDPAQPAARPDPVVQRGERAPQARSEVGST